MAGTRARRDVNFVPTLLAEDSSDYTLAPVPLVADVATGRLLVNATLSGSVGGSSATDNTAFAAGTDSFTVSGGFYHSTIDTVTDGRAAAVALTPKRAFHATLHTAAGVETGIAVAPLQVSLANTGANGTAMLVTGTGGTFPVTGTFWQATQPVSLATNTPTLQSGSTTAVTQATGTNLHTVVDSGTVTTVTTLTGTTTLTPGTAAANLGKAEDGAHTTGDVGVMALAVNNVGAANSFNSTDLDYTPIGVDGQGRVYTTPKAPTGTLSNVASSATNVTVLAANTARLGATIVNDSTQLLYLKFGTTASTSSYTVVLAGASAAPFAYYEVPFGYTGKIDGIWSSANGNARVTEMT